jgi:hypothetical protein
VLLGERLSASLTWVIRGLMALGGVILVLLAWPVMRSALQAQRADTVVGQLRNARPLSMPNVARAIEALDQAVADDPAAGRRLQRAELLINAALTPQLKPTQEQRKAWLLQAKEDLDRGLGEAPARGMDWLRLAIARQAIDGVGRDVVPPLLMSIDVAPMFSPIWEVRLRVILDNWGYFNEEQRAKIQSYVVATWRASTDRLWFGRVVRDAVDELILRQLLRGEPGGLEELTKWIRHTRK